MHAPRTFLHYILLLSLMKITLENPVSHNLYNLTSYIKIWQDPTVGNGTPEESRYPFSFSFCGLCIGHCLSLHLSGIVFGRRNFLAVARKFLRPRLATSPAGSVSLRPTKTKMILYLSCLCGLWLGLFLSLHRSGIVFVPSIMSAPQVGQRLPVGFALMAYLHLGYCEQL